jgi:hypothetical protein
MYEVPSLKGDEYSTMPTMAPAPAPTYASTRTPASSSQAESQMVEKEASEEPVPDPYKGMGRLAIIKTLRNRGVDYSDLPNVDALRDKARETDLDYQAKLREKEKSKQQRSSHNTSVAISAQAQPSKELTGACIDVVFCAGTLMGVIRVRLVGTRRGVVWSVPGPAWRDVSSYASAYIRFLLMSFYFFLDFFLRFFFALLLRSSDRCVATPAATPVVRVQRMGGHT